MPTAHHNAHQYSQKVPLAQFWAVKPTLIITLLLLALLFRARPLTLNRFHADEALYGHYAQRIASGRDPLLHDIAVDKPPLVFYLAAASLAQLGPQHGGEPLKAEFALRLPALFASLVAVALVYPLGRALYSHSAGLWAALLLALSPFAIQFSPTLFLDPLIVTLLLAAFLAAHHQRWALTGLLLGLAFATKQTALLYAPLAVSIGLLSPRFVWTWPTARHAAFALTLGFLPPLALTLGWDLLRAPDRDFWSLGVDQNLPRRLIRSTELLPRLRAWWAAGQYLIGDGLATTLALLTLPVLAIRALTGPRTRSALVTLFLLGYVLAYLALYTFFAFATFDRYLLGLAPLLALLIGATIAQVTNWPAPHPRAAPVITAVLLAGLLLPSAIAASRTAYPIGGDHGGHDGLDAVSAYLDAVPTGSVVYDYWLSWPLRFYLYDAPVLVIWQPGPAALATDLQAFGRTTSRYMVVPAWAPFNEFEHAIGQTGYTTELVFTATGRTAAPTFYVYQFTPTP